MQTCDVAVIGAGIVGAACAYELASSGLRVALVDPNAAGAGGTALGFGSLSIVQDLPGQFELTRHGLDLWQGLAEWLPADCEYQRSGTIWIAADEAEMREAVRRWEFLNRHGVEAELLDAKQVAEAETELARETVGGLFVAGDGAMRTSKAAEFLTQLAAQKGAFAVRQKVTAIREHEVELEDGTTLYAGNIINAAGAEALALTRDLPLVFSKGHVLMVETGMTCVRRRVASLGVISDAGMEGSTVRFEVRQSRFAEPSAVWIGSSYQQATETTRLQVEPRLVAVLLRMAIETIPAIGRARPAGSWTGLRTGTKDGLPLIGRVAGKESIFAATGHEGYGATAALATAKLIADEILCRTPAIEAGRFLADRFERENSSKHAK